MARPNAAMLGYLSSAFLLLVLNHSLRGCFGFPVIDSVESVLAETSEQLASSTVGEEDGFLPSRGVDTSEFIRLIPPETGLKSISRNVGSAPEVVTAAAKAEADLPLGSESPQGPNYNSDVSVTNSETSTDSGDSTQWEATAIGISRSSTKNLDYLATTRDLSRLRNRADSLQFKLLRFIGLFSVIAIGTLAAAYFLGPAKLKYSETVLVLGSQLLTNFPREVKFMYKGAVLESGLVLYAPVNYEATAEEIDEVLSTISQKLEAIVLEGGRSAFTVFAPMSSDHITVRKIK